MSKKNLTKPLPKTQPTSDEMDAFINRGAGKDTDKRESINTEQQKSVNTEVKSSVVTGISRLTVDLPQAQHRRFKIACTVAGKKMNDEIRRFIDRRCAELETPAE